MSFAGLNTAHNYSFYAIPVAFGLAIAPHAYAMALFNKERAPGTAEWDNVHPFKNTGLVKDAKLPPAQADKFLRAEAAQSNQFVNLPLFAAAVLAGNAARIEPKALNTAVGVFLVARAAYNYVYITHTTKLGGHLRSVLWLTSVGASLSLFIQAGNKFFNGYVAF